MSEHGTDDVLELAQKRIAERKEQEQQERVSRGGDSWRFALIGLFGALLLGLLAWPNMTLDRKMYSVVHGVCAQIHNVQVGGLDLPLCARNTGIYSSFLISSVYLVLIGRGRAARLPSIPITLALVLFVLAMGVDGINSTLVDINMWHLYTPQNWLRTLTGIGMGVTIAVFLLMVVNLSLRKNAEAQQPVLGSWLELAGVLLVNGLVWVAIYGNIGVMYWPVAITAWLGITGVLYMVNVLLAGLFMGYENAVTHVSQLAKPASIALIMTVIELGLLSSLRFWLESQGMVAGL
jgi:uncharacterized membrane protein